MSIHAEDCDAGNVCQHVGKLLESLAASIEPERHQRWFAVRSQAGVEEADKLKC